MKKRKLYLPFLALCLALCFSLTGCGNSGNGSTSGNNENNTGDNVADDIGDAVEDVADGVGDAVDDLVGNGGFNNYNDAHDYFLETMGSYHADANFELRDEDQELNDYQEGSKGYHFHLYDTSNDESGEYFGEFYVDATSGKILKKDDEGTISEYPGAATDTTSKGTTGSTSNGTTANTTGTSGTNEGK